MTRRNVFISRIGNIGAIGDMDQDQGTPGILTVDGLPFTCVTLELPWRANQADKSRVPVNPNGYAGDLYTPNNLHLVSPVYALSGVEGRADCLLHNGTWAGDVDMGFKSDVEGCTLLGSQFAMLDPGAGFKGPQFCVINSRETVQAFMAALNGEPINVIYRDAA